MNCPHCNLPDEVHGDISCLQHRLRKAEVDRDAHRAALVEAVEMIENISGSLDNGLLSSERAKLDRAREVLGPRLKMCPKTSAYALLSESKDKKKIDIAHSCGMHLGEMIRGIVIGRGRVDVLPDSEGFSCEIGVE